MLIPGRHHGGRSSLRGQHRNRPECARPDLRGGACASAGPRKQTFSWYDTLVDLTAIDIETGAARVLLPSRLPGRTGPAFARYSPSGRFLAYVSAARPVPTGGAGEVCWTSAW